MEIKGQWRGAEEGRAAELLSLCLLEVQNAGVMAEEREPSSLSDAPRGKATLPVFISPSPQDPEESPCPWMWV